MQSRKPIAEGFGKRHDHVLRDIENLKKDVPNFGEMFYESTAPDKYGRENKIYLINKKGFMLLVMGFNGAKAIEMVGREHKKVMRDIRKIMEHLGESKIGPGTYFIDSTYSDVNFTHLV